MPAREPDSIVIGRLGAPYGIKGWLKIQSYTQPAENITRYSPWLIDGDPVTPQRVQRHNNGFIVQLPGVDDRDAASRWTGKNVAMNPTQLPVTEDDEYYWHELIGAQVVDAADSEVGRVVDLLATGPHDVLIIARPDSSELLVPFVERYVPDVDLAAQRVRIDWPEV